jgi:hypothetical protein
MPVNSQIVSPGGVFEGTLTRIVMDTVGVTGIVRSASSAAITSPVKASMI